MGANFSIAEAIRDSKKNYIYVSKIISFNFLVNYLISCVYMTHPWYVYGGQMTAWRIYFSHHFAPMVLAQTVTLEQRFLHK